MEGLASWAWGSREDKRRMKSGISLNRQDPTFPFLKGQADTPETSIILC